MDGRVTCSDAFMGGGGCVFLHGLNNAGITVSVQCMGSFLDVALVVTGMNILEPWLAMFSAL